MKLIIQLLNFLTPYGMYATWLMFIILLACGFGLPLPEDVVLVTAGILSSHGVTEFWMTNAICFAGVLIGDSTIYFLGNTKGAKIKELGLFKRILTPKREAKVQLWFNKYGDKVIFFARFMPGLRMPLFLTSGIYKVPFWKFISLDGLAALISVPFWIWLGFQFGANLELLEAKMRRYQEGSMIFAGAAIFILIFGWFFKTRLTKFMER